ncbi:MAG TPA: hypothetical protein VKS24_19240 [Bradyrhizobium sp.]|nr:hypothetical protein [Bradyrhizobium sp.]
MTRFVLFVCMAFATAFVGVTWAARGFPMWFYYPRFANQLQPLVTATFGDQSAKDYERKMWEAEHTAQSDGDPKLDKIRLEALQAANAYTQSPCGETTKLNLIAAVTAYTRAWQRKMDCPRPQNMLMFCGDEKLKEVAAAFSTPLDIRVKAALHEAFEQRGIVKADFPADLRQDMLQFAGPGLWFDESPVCLPRMRAAGTAR